MDAFWEVMRQAGVWGAYAVVVLLCLAGIAISCLALSGTWLIALSAIIAVLLRPADFPGWWTVVVFLILAGAVELVEALAASWGVQKRGGSKAAGWVALLGGVLGLFLGGLIPIPVVGPLLGMLICSFVLVYLVEKRRLQHAGQAADIAMGSVIARVLVILLKVMVSLGMAAALLLGMLLNLL